MANKKNWVENSDYWVQLTKSIEELSAKDFDDEGNQNYLSRIRKVKSVANLRIQINDSDGLVSQLIVPRDLVNEDLWHSKAPRKPECLIRS